MHLETQPMRYRLAALLLLALPGVLVAQPDKEPPPGEKPPPEKTPEDLPPKDVALALNTGGHTEPIYQMRFTPDGKRLVTARGSEVRVWDVDTGRQEQVWRLPGGNGRLAVSPDGKTVATAGPVQGRKDNAAVWLLPLKPPRPPQGKPGARPAAEPAPEVIRLPLPANFETHSITALAFSPDSSRLACGEGYWVHVYDRRAKAITHSIQPQSRGQRHPHTMVERLQFSKDGNRLLVALGDIYGLGFGPQVWDVRRPARPGPGPEQPPEPLFSLKDAHEPWAAWSADDETFAVLRAGWQHDLVLWSKEGTPQPRTREQAQQLQRRLAAEFGTSWWWPNGGIHFLGKTDQVVAAAFNGLAGGTAVLFDPQKGKVDRLYRGPAQTADFFTTAVSPDGKRLAVTGDPGYEVILIDVATKEEVGRVGVPTPVPKFVGWGTDGKTIFWGVRREAGKPPAEALTAGLNLATLEPPGEQERKELRPRGASHPDGWQVTLENGSKRKDKADGVVVMRPDGVQLDTPVRGTLHPAWTHYQDRQSRQDRLVITMNRDVHLYDPQANKVLYTLEHSGAARVFDVAVSPDGKYLLVPWGQQFLQLYNIEGKPQRLLNVLAVDEDWVAWTPQGYYAATPGGEKLIGWQVKKDDSTPLTFYPIERFRKFFSKPDVIKHLLQTGSVEAALKAARAKEVAIEDVLPPAVRITEVVEIKAGGGAILRVTAEATPRAEGQPVESLRLLLDGRPHPDARQVDVKPEVIKAGAPARALWVIDPVPGQHELKVLARCPDVSGVSEPHTLNAALADKDKPLLYRVCVGINKYDQKGLELGSASQDAEAVFKALEKDCTGKGNRFREAKGKKLLDREATCQAVLEALKEARQPVGVQLTERSLAALRDAGVPKEVLGKLDALKGKEFQTEDKFLDEVRKRLTVDERGRYQELVAKQARKEGVKPGDLLVLFFGGHGVVQEGDFFLLTREADTGKPLMGKSLSGEDLRAALGAMPCSVLLVMDACHSAAGVPFLKQFKPATDDLARSLTDDQAAVTVLAAAMGYETAAEEKHGLFTQALLDGLQASAGVPFDPDDHQMYVHHLYGYVFGKVRKASGEKQHPFLNMPWTVPPLALRQVP
jgi:WD40 repeat protein